MRPSLALVTMLAASLVALPTAAQEIDHVLPSGEGLCGACSVVLVIGAGLAYAIWRRSPAK